MPYSELDVLKSDIEAAIELYVMSYPQRAKTAHRARDIAAIKAILKNQKTTRDEVLELRKEIDDFFNSTTYFRGFFDESQLEQMIGDALFTHHQHEKPRPKEATNEKWTIAYKPSDFIMYALDKYTQEKGPDLKEYRKDNIEQIKRYLINGNDYITPIKAYLKSEEFTHPHNSRLKKYILDALSSYLNNQSTREVNTTVWLAKQETNSSKIIIFLHGWHDSLEAGHFLAEEAVQQGFTVIAYDHRGHGQDAQRQQKNTSTDLLRLDFRKFFTTVREKYPHAEISLVGHSMGGAILANEHAWINKHEINKVVLLAPAVMSSLSKMINPTKFFCRNTTSSVIEYQQQSGRFGGKGPNLFSLLNLMQQAAQALKQLFAEAQSNWFIFSGKKDASVNYQEFTALQEKKPGQIHFFPRADHLLQMGNHAKLIIQKLLETLDEKPTNQPTPV